MKTREEEDARRRRHEKKKKKKQKKKQLKKKIKNNVNKTKQSIIRGINQKKYYEVCLDVDVRFDQRFHFSYVVLDLLPLPLYLHRHHRHHRFSCFFLKPFLVETSPDRMFFRNLILVMFCHNMS